MRSFQDEPCPDPKNAVPVLQPRRPRPGYRRVVVDWRPVAMQAAHLPAPEGGVRCSICMGPVFTARRHFCRWKSMRELETRATNRQRLYVPVYRWIRIEGGGQ
jgi:hypothetical protein